MLMAVFKKVSGTRRGFNRDFKVCAPYLQTQKHMTATRPTSAPVKHQYILARRLRGLAALFVVIWHTSLYWSPPL